MSCSGGDELEPLLVTNSNEGNSEQFIILLDVIGNPVSFLSQL
jgi:hypothetical protein